MQCLPPCRELEAESLVLVYPLHLALLFAVVVEMWLLGMMLVELGTALVLVEPYLVEIVVVVVFVVERSLTVLRLPCLVFLSAMLLRELQPFSSWI